MLSRLRKSLLILSIVALVGVAGVFIWHIYRKWKIPSLEKNGGTVLVYEVDEGEKPIDFKPEELAATLRRRIDPEELYGVVVRPVDGNRIEIVLPHQRPGSEQEVREVKELISRAGKLEFCIVANDRDDSEAISAARTLFKSCEGHTKVVATNKAVIPPPAPECSNAEGFPTPLGRYTYSWVKLGTPVRKSWKLPDDAEPVGEPERPLPDFESAREKHEVIEYDDHLLYNRFIGPSLIGEKRAPSDTRRIEFFVLVRNPEPGMELSGDLVKDVKASSNKHGPFVDITLTPASGERFRTLTSKNLPDNKKYESRHLAIILDGQILSAPAIREQIGERGQISGRFTQEEVDQMVKILRAGALPATLKPVPVSESTVAPKK